MLKLLSPLEIEGDAFGQIYEYFMGTNTVKHLAFTHCGELNLFGMVDAQVAVAERELLATDHRP